MENLKQFEELLLPVLKTCNVRLYEVKFEKTKKASTLLVAIMKQDGSMDLDTCAIVSEKISEILDTHEELIDGEYFLEVCSPGVERELRNIDEIKEAVSKNVYIKFEKEIKGFHEITGVLASIDDQNLMIHYRDKAATRKLEVSVENISFIRLAV